MNAEQRPPSDDMSNPDTGVTLTDTEAQPSTPPPAYLPQQRGSVTPHHEARAGRIVAAIIGALLVLESLPLIGGGGTALWADRTQRDAGYVTTDVHQLSTSGSALVTKAADLGSGGTGWLHAPGLLDQVRIRVTPSQPGSSFVGIGPSADVSRYLDGVHRTLISDYWTDRFVDIGGSVQPSDPAGESFWVASTSGSGPQTLTWAPTDGSWSVVVMNTDGRPGVSVASDFGARLPAAPWIALGVLVFGALLAVGGALLIVGGLRRRHPTAAAKRTTRM